MVSLSEFHQVQKHLKQQNRKQGKHDFAFNGLIRCGHCGGAVCGEKKTVKLSDGRTNVHFYYSCANSKKTCVRKVVNEATIERQISQVLETLAVPVEFIAFAKQVIAHWKDEEMQNREAVKQKQAEAIQGLERKRDKLLEMKLNDLLSDAEYREEKEKVQAEIVVMRMSQQQSHEDTDALWESIENAAVLLHYGQAFFEGGNAAMQHLIAKTLGATFVLTDRSLAIELSPVFGRIAQLKSELGADMQKSIGAEPVPERENEAENSFQSQQNAPLDGERLVWWNILDTTRTALRSSRLAIPNFMPNNAS